MYAHVLNRFENALIFGDRNELMRQEVSNCEHGWVYFQSKHGDYQITIRYDPNRLPRFTQSVHYYKVPNVVVAHQSGCLANRCVSLANHNISNADFTYGHIFAMTG